MNRLLLAIIFICLTSFSMAQNPVPKQQDKKQFVLILSSYGYDDEWGTSIAKDIRSRIEGARPDISVVITYAGIGNRNSFLSDRYAMQGAFSSGRLNLHVSVPDILILIGDESWMFYRIMNLRGIWEKVPVVLCGIHPEIMSDYSRFFKDKSIPDSLMVPVENSKNNLHVTGVMVEDNSKRTIGIIRYFLPALKTIYFLSNGNYQDVLALKNFRHSLTTSHPEITLVEIPFSKKSPDSVREMLNSLPVENSALVVNMIPVPQNIEIPVFTLRDVPFRGMNPVAGSFVGCQEFSKYAVNIAKRIYGGTPTDSIPWIVVTGLANPYLNRKGIEHFDISPVGYELSGAVNRNLPPPFFIRYIRPLCIGLLIITILFFVGFIYLRSIRYRRRLINSFERFKSLYNEYQVIYENMPIGLLQIDRRGAILNNNANAEQFLDCFFPPETADFNVFRSPLLGDTIKCKILEKELLSTVLTIEGICFRVIFRPITDVDTGEDTILMIVIDITDIRIARNAKDKIYDALNFAMDASSLGIAEYELLTKKGFATKAWYENLAVEQGSEDFDSYHDHIYPEDAQKLYDFFQKVKEGSATLFLDTIRVQCPVSGEIHWVRYLIQPMDYAPEKGRIVMAELTFNVDEQMQREGELSSALKKAQEADRLKNAFVANMRNDIRTPLEEIISCSMKLIETTDPEEKQFLYDRIEKGNETMLRLLLQIIDCSREEEPDR